MITRHALRTPVLVAALLAAQATAWTTVAAAEPDQPPAAAPAAATAESACGSTKGGFTFWLNFRLCELARTMTPADDQVEAPSATAGSTSIVEKGTAPDIFSLALGLVGAGGNEDEDDTATTMTVSAYAVRSSVTGENPLDPAVYAKHRNWRRYSFTTGRADGEGDTPDGRVFAVKVLAIDKRDTSDSANKKHFAKLNEILSTEADLVGTANQQAIEFIAAALPQLPRTSVGDFGNKHLGLATYEATLKMLTDSQRAELDALLLAPAGAFAKAHATIDPLVQAIRKAPQLALSYQALVRPQDADDEHHFDVVFDVGLGSRLAATANGGIVRIDRKFGEDTTAAKVAGELQFDLQRLASFDDVVRRNGRDPITISVAGLGEWHSDEGPNIGKLQVKLTLPLPGILGGLKIPISVTYANRSELIDETEIRGNVGFTLDLSKLQNSLRAFRR